MRFQNRPLRSLLFCPASKPRVLEKARTLRCDGVIVDLEDAVGAHQKAEAREALIRFGAARGADKRLFLVRINAVGTPWFEADLQAALAAGADGIVLPKVQHGSDVAALATALDRAGADPDICVLTMIETPLGVLNLREIATASARMAGLILGPNDLIKDLGAQADPGRTALAATLGQIVLVARAYGLACLDGVYNAFRDAEGFRAECAQGRLLGYDGKTLIHPGQIDAANGIFAPSEEEIARARRMIVAFGQAQALGEAVTAFEGEMLEELNVRAAQALLEKSAMMAAMTEDGTGQ